jgi:hypothetical protein
MLRIEESGNPANVDDIEKTGISRAKSIVSSRTESTTLPQYSERWVDDGDKEVVAMGEGKEVVPSEGLQTLSFGDEKHVIVPEHEKEAFLGFPQRSGPRAKQSKRRIFGMRRRPFFLTVGLGVACCSILAIALALNLGKNSKWVLIMVRCITIS